MKKLIPILLLFLAACSQERNTPGPASTRLTERRYFATATQTSRTQFIYDGEGRIAEMRSLTSSGEVTNRVVYRWVNSTVRRTEVYHSNAPWSSSLQSGAPLKLYFVTLTRFGDGGRPVSANNYTVDNGQEVFRSVTTYVYDTQGFLIRKENRRPTDNNLLSYTTYENDGRGNALTERLYTNVVGEKGSLNITTTYEYDDRPNPYRTAQLMDIVWYSSPNNIVRHTTVNAISGEKGDQRYLYTYRRDGYPDRMLYADGRKEEFVYDR